MVALVLAIGLLITAAVAWTSWALDNRNENRLLERQTQLVGYVIAAAIPSTQVPLSSAADVARATNGNVEKFLQEISPYVGPGRQFVTASLWQMTDGVVTPLASAGAAPDLASSSPQASAFVERAFKSSTFVVSGLLGKHLPRLGYAYALGGATAGFAVYTDARDSR